MLHQAEALLKPSLGEVAEVCMGGILGLGDLWQFLCPYSPLTYVFLALLAISIYFIFVPDVSSELSWLLLLLFSVLALSPGVELEE